ncbi:hypothetical protein EXIGLDRAFT_240818 [Exidia glandulosa HHB12029]|uniref:Uncharacterized protein n=1 Tax=Exidia glandulosa HHB12029 TaxID=1314781 RepID=A0A165Q6L5_EXIGL|nr:hypothetical protein EXIGLDRAFT_240818 [Exidia glandulosa HHB12029]
MPRVRPRRWGCSAHRVTVPAAPRPCRQSSARPSYAYCCSAQACRGGGQVRPKLTRRYERSPLCNRRNGDEDRGNAVVRVDQRLERDTFFLCALYDIPHEVNDCLRRTCRRVIAEQRHEFVETTRTSHSLAQGW